MKNKINILIFLFVIFIMAMAFKLFYKDYINKSKQIIINDFHNAVYEQNMIPMSDEEGKKVSPYEFVVENISSKTKKYNLYLNEVKLTDDNNNEDTIPQKVLKYQLIINDKEIAVGFLSDLNKGLLNQNNLKGLSNNKYIVRIWITENTEDEAWYNKTFNYQFSVVEK